MSLCKLKSIVQACHKCSELSTTRTNIVFGEGPARTPLFIIGEAPGQKEDLTGKPFMGMAGKLLSDILFKAEINRDKVYIANMLKCRPPENRPPEQEELNNCKDYLFKQIELVNPKLIVTLGNVSTRFILSITSGITTVRGSFFKRQLGAWNGSVLPTYHPSFLLRNRGQITNVVEDFMKAREWIKHSAKK